MEIDFTKILTNWGPLSIGWVVAWLMWRRLLALQDKLVEVFQANTRALDKLTTELEGPK